VIVEPDSAYTVAGVVSSVVPLTILAAAAFFYVRHRQRRQAQQQWIQSSDGLDIYEQRAPLMYVHPTTPVPFILYVSLLLSATEAGNPS